MNLAVLIGHILAVAIGAGGAWMSDILFFTSIFDNKIDKSEYKVLKMASKIVLVGLALLYITGVLLIVTGSAPSQRFWAKMTIVGVITINGMIMHRRIFPVMKQCMTDRLAVTSQEVLRHAPLAISCGAISAVSWNMALVLGAWRSLPLGYVGIMGSYLLIVTLAVIGGNVTVKLAMRNPEIVGRIHGMISDRLAQPEPLFDADYELDNMVPSAGD